jgi:hypothetical protein
MADVPAALCEDEVRDPEDDDTARGDGVSEGPEEAGEEEAPAPDPDAVEADTGKDDEDDEEMILGPDTTVPKISVK